MKLITIFLTLFTIQNTFSIDYLRLTKMKAFIKGSLFFFEEIDKDPYIGDCVVSYKEAVKGDVSVRSQQMVTAFGGKNPGLGYHLEC